MGCGKLLGTMASESGGMRGCMRDQSREGISG